MSLADLKKKKKTKTVKKLSVEEFINDATAYSQGQSVLDKPGDVLPNKASTRKKKKRTKHATFSLSQKCIVQLNKLTQETGVNKSKLVRLLVDSASSNGVVGLLEEKEQPKDKKS